MNNRIKILILGFVAVLCTVLGIVSFNSKEDEGPIVENTVPQEAENPGTQASEKEITPAQIAVFVCGEVNSPGVYSFYEGERIQAAVERAGGFTGEADENYINQAGYLTDGAKLYFPSREEVDRMGEVFENSEIPNDAGQVNKSTGLVNINTATHEELMTLPGVGQSKADSIINFRNEHGAFKRIEDIMNITGIKEGLFGKIKDKITV